MQLESTVLSEVSQPRKGKRSSFFLLGMVLTQKLSCPSGDLEAHPSYRRTPLLSTGHMHSSHRGAGSWTLRLCPPCSGTSLPLIPWCPKAGAERWGLTTHASSQRATNYPGLQRTLQDSVGSCLERRRHLCDPRLGSCA